MTSPLPTPAKNFKYSAGVRLITQGIMLHVATLAGPMDVFKKKGQRAKASKLFFSEYGLNLVLLALLQLLIFQYLKPYQYFLGELSAISALIVLSVIQMFVDSYRNQIRIYHSAKYEAGISVRVAGEKAWAFFNHYALPVGRKHGVHLRSELHKQAQSKGFLLFCYAQNIDVANYYIREHPQGKLILNHSKRPLLIWDYRDEADRQKSSFEAVSNSKKFDLFGLNSTRNSGSLPL
jgi:hypothetical protein